MTEVKEDEMYHISIMLAAGVRSALEIQTPAH